MAYRKQRWRPLSRAGFIVSPPGLEPTDSQLKTVGPPPAFEPTDAEWETIGGDYCQLSQDDKEAISRAVTQYFREKPFETSVHRHSELTSRLDTIREAASSLYQALNPRDEIGSIALEMVVARLQNVNKHRDRICLSPEDAMGLVADFRVAAAMEKRELNEDSTPGIQIGDSWRQWVRNVMDWAEARELPVRIANRTDNSKNWPSPFVKFFSRLQGTLPEQYRGPEKHGPLTDALLVVRRNSKKRTKRESI